MEWVAKATPRPLYSREKPGTDCVVGCEIISSETKIINDKNVLIGY